MTVKTKYTIEFGGLDRRGAEYSNSISVEGVSDRDGLVRFINAIFEGEYSTVNIIAIQQEMEAVIDCPICGHPIADCVCFEDNQQLKRRATGMGKNGRDLYGDRLDDDCLICGEPRDICECVWHANI